MVSCRHLSSRIAATSLIYIPRGTIYYDTKWVPNTDILVQLADQFGVGFVHMYSEFAMGIFGEANYGQGILTDARLDHEDFSRFEYDESGVYLFEGQSYETDMEILELLLERKKTGPDSPGALQGKVSYGQKRKIPHRDIT